MSLMSADAFIQVRVAPEVKARLQALAERENITESALVRQLLLTMLRVQVSDRGIGTRSDGGHTARLTCVGAT